MERYLQFFNGRSALNMTTVLVKASDIRGGVQFLDARFNLADPQAGKQAFAAGHIEGARHIDIEEHLSDMSSDAGRHPMPTKAQLTATFRQLGLTYDKPIYIYDNGGEPFAARAYFMLQYGGFTNSYIVQDGYEALQRAGFEVTTEVETTMSDVDVQFNDDLYVNRAAVKEVARGKADKVLLDARSAVRYRGEDEPIDAVAGHIPRARNYDWEQLVTDGMLAPNATLANTVSQNESIIVYCGSGVTASPLYAMLKEAGYPNVQVYTGSYSDWIREEPVVQEQ